MDMDNENMKIYEAVRKCPDTALRAIQAGRLKGKSDINPMWRIKTLTEQFGACGFGWYYDVTRQWTEVGANGEIAAFVNIDLYVKIGDEWSKPIHGTGGSAFVAKERNGMFTSDECYKMALTDAISVACKALGMAADVYWQTDSTKYSMQNQPTPNELINCPKCGEKVNPITDKNGQTYFPEQILQEYKMCIKCAKKLKNGGNENA